MSDNRKLAAELREIARLWEENLLDIRFRKGICWALAEHRGNPCMSGDRTQAYGEISGVLGKVQQGFITYLDDDFFDWEPRANMCLLMAHWLEDQA